MLALPVIFTTSCKKENIVYSKEIYKFKNTPRNQDYNNLALIINKAINENPNFKMEIKAGVLEQFDGDFEILLKDLKEREIKDNNGKKVAVKDYLNGIAKKILSDEKLEGFEARSIDDYINYLSSQYPDMQIAVPVHAEDWTDDYDPPVTFIPEELQERQNVDLLAYQGNDTTSVNTQVEPASPVVVISDNERIGSGHLQNLSINGWNLQSIQTTSGIKLTWDFTSYTDNIAGYYIYRKDANSSNFTRIGTVLGFNNRVFDDNTVLSNQFYSYYVTAFDFQSESNASNIVSQQAPPRPEALSNFSVNMYVSNFLDIRWDIPSTQAIDFVQLEKLTYNVDNSYQLVGQFDDTYHNYFYQSPIPGDKIIFRANIHHGNYVSNYKYDFIQVPYRDVSRRTPVYLEKISFNWDEISSIEPWWKGKPEFVIAIVATNENGQTSQINEVHLRFCKRHSWNYFNDINLYNWLPTSFLDVLSFKIAEEDGGPKVDVNLNASYQQKTTTNEGHLGTVLNLGVGVTIHDVFGSKDDPIGTCYLYYTDPETIQLSVPGSLNFKMIVSTTDQDHECYP